MSGADDDTRVVVDPAIAAEPVVASEVVTDKRPTFEATPVADPSPSPTDEKPELLVGAAFAGGLVAALILKRLGR